MTEFLQIVLVLIIILNPFIFNVNYILIYNNEYYRENHLKK